MIADRHAIININKNHSSPATSRLHNETTNQNTATNTHWWGNETANRTASINTHWWGNNTTNMQYPTTNMHHRCLAPRRVHWLITVSSRHHLRPYPRPSWQSYCDHTKY